MTDIAALGASLIQFLWQGVLLAVALRVILLFCRQPIIRYNWALATLCALATCPIATFLFLKTHPLAADGLTSPWTVWALLTAGATPAASAMTLSFASMSWLEWTAALWLVGVILFGSRAIGGGVLVGRYRREGVTPLPKDIVQLFDILKRRLSIAAPIVCFQSTAVRVPMVIGWWRPIILVPTATILRLTRHQLETILAHELAHIARLDTFTNGFQMIVETLLFYHPAVWWVSREIRIEREHCCDDLAVELCGDPISYGRALAELAGEGAAFSALAADGGDLKRRITRLFGAPDTRPIAGYVAIAISFVLGSVVAVTALAAPNSSQIALTYPIPLSPAPPKYADKALADKEPREVQIAFTIVPDRSVVEPPALHSEPAVLFDATSFPIVAAAALAAPISNDTMPLYPRPSSQVPPKYPDDALTNQLEGEVEIEFTIAPNGSVVKPHVLRSEPASIFDEASLTAIRKWHYENKTKVAVSGRHAIIKYRLS